MRGENTIFGLYDLVFRVVKSLNNEVFQIEMTTKVVYEAIREKNLLPEPFIQEVISTLIIAANDEKNMIKNGEIPNLNKISLADETPPNPPKIPFFEVPNTIPILRESLPKESSITSSIDYSKSPSDSLSSSQSEYSSGGEEGQTGSLNHNSRGRKRMYTDEERRRRKNRSSKLSRDKHSRRVKQNQMKLQKLQTEYEIEENRRRRQRAAIDEKRKELCPSCLSIIDQTLERLRKGENFVHLKWQAKNCTGGRSKKHINPVVIKQEIIESEVQHC